MSSRGIKELRQKGNLEEALNMAKLELKAAPDNIWAKRNISWVHYDYLKQNCSIENFDSFLSWLTEIRNLGLPAEEKMLFDHLGWQIGSMVFKTINSEAVQIAKIMQLFKLARCFPYTKPSDGYSFLYKAFHKALKDTDSILLFADWWDFSNFRPEDFQKEILPDGKEIMAIAEQGYITYAKHLLPKHIHDDEVVFDREKAQEFLPKLAKLSEQYPQFQYPPYFQAKLLVALGDQENVLSALMPFAKKKKNDFWVWEVLADAFSNDEDKVFAFYCKALSCNSPEEMLVGLRQRMAALFIKRRLFNEARTEIELLVSARNSKRFRIPSEVMHWQSESWYTNAAASKNNKNFYSNYISLAEGCFYTDIPEETVIVEFVNSDKKMLSYIATETKTGFFKYDRFLKLVKVGDVLGVRFQSTPVNRPSLVYTVRTIEDHIFKEKFYKRTEGIVQIKEGSSFGFLGNAFIHPSLIIKYKLVNNSPLVAYIMKSYNKEKMNWGWKVVQILQ